MKALAFALVLSLSLLGAGRARAADLPLPGGAPIPPSSYYPVSPPINWGGVYIGLNGGYGLGQSNWSNSLGCSEPRKLDRFWLEFSAVIPRLGGAESDEGIEIFGRPEGVHSEAGC